MGRPLRREEWAAAVNGLIVLCLPSMVFAALDRTPWPGTILVVVRFATAMLPYALVAAWRTWSHARGWESGDRGWLGIVEAGVCGFVAVVLGLLRTHMHDAAQALPLCIVYGFFGFIGALPVGVLLFLTARLVLRLTGERPAGGLRRT